MQLLETVAGTMGAVIYEYPLIHQAEFRDLPLAIREMIKVIFCSA